MIITFSGTHGAGKTTTAKALAHQLGYEYYSVGSVMREIAKQRGITVKELAEQLSREPEIDRKIDAETQALANKKNIVVDARMGWYFLPDSLKVFITAPLKKRAQRTFNDPRKGDGFVSVKDAASQLEARQEQLSQNLVFLYGVDPYQESNFDMIIDSSEKSVDEVVHTIVAAIQS